MPIVFPASTHGGGEVSKGEDEDKWRLQAESISIRPGYLACSVAKHEEVLTSGTC